MKLTIDDVASFCWGFDEFFFLETDKGNYVWSDPEYSGDNTIRKFNGTYEKWCKSQSIPFARDKGQHIIRNYCGDAVIII